MNEHLSQEFTPVVEGHVHVACASDERFSPFCATMLHSLFEHTNNYKITIHYLCPPEFSEKIMRMMELLVASDRQTIKFHIIPDAMVNGLPAMRGIRRIIWYRVLLADLLPDVNRVLYLDADTLITDTLAPLFDTNIDSVPLAAVPDIVDPRLRLQQLEALHLPASAVYFNSGVMLMNLKQIRNVGSAIKVIEYARRYGDRFRWGDQDALNAIYATGYKLLHPRWNSQSNIYSQQGIARLMYGDRLVEEATEQPAIVHFGGNETDRPWHYLCQHPYRNAYIHHLRQTPWRNLRLQGRTAKNILKKHLPDSILLYISQYRGQ